MNTAILLSSFQGVFQVWALNDGVKNWREYLVQNIHGIEFELQKSKFLKGKRSFQVCKETLSALNNTQKWILYNVFNSTLLQNFLIKVDTFSVLVVTTFLDIKLQRVNMVVIWDVRFSYTLYGIFIFCVVDRYRNNLCAFLRKSGVMIMYSA